MSDPIRVLFIHASREDANEYTVHRNLAAHVDPEKVDSYFIWQSTTQNPKKNVQPRLARTGRVFHWDFGRNQSIHPRPPKIIRVLNVILRFPLSFLFLINKVREIKPDVIYTTQQGYEVTLANALSKLFGIPHIIHVCYYIGPWLGKSTFPKIVKNPHVFGSCEFVRQTGIDAGIPPENIEAMHHMADFETYDLPRDRHWLRSQFGWSDDTPVVTAAARLDKDKGFVRLVEAFAIAHKNVPAARLLICGTPSAGTTHDQVIRKRVQDLGLEDVVAFAGFRSDLPKIFAGTDVFCQPIKYDASSLVILGAMVAGVPVVSSYSGSVPEIVVHGKTGLLAELEDKETLANHLQTLLCDPELAEQMGKAGKERAWHTFGPHVISSTWTEKLYRRIARIAVAVGNV